MRKTTTGEHRPELLGKLFRDAAYVSKRTHHQNEWLGHLKKGMEKELSVLGVPSDAWREVSFSYENDEWMGEYLVGKHLPRGHLSHMRQEEGESVRYRKAEAAAWVAAIADLLLRVEDPEDRLLLARHLERFHVALTIPEAAEEIRRRAASGGSATARRNREKMAPVWRAIQERAHKMHVENPELSKDAIARTLAEGFDWHAYHVPPRKWDTVSRHLKGFRKEPIRTS